VNSSEELKVQVNAMAETIKDLQSQITCKEEQLVEKTKEIKDQRGKVNVLAANIKHLRSELVTAKAEIKNKDKQIQFNFEKISEITEELLECKPKGFCPSEGPSGIYNITMRGIDTFEVPCNSKGWLTIQKRFDGSENFDRPWKDYKDGFGNTTGEFFIGLEKMHHMTHEQPHELYIALRKIDGSTSYAHYKDFKIGRDLLLGLHGGGGCSTGRLLHLLVFRPRLRHLAGQSVTTRLGGRQHLGLLLQIRVGPLDQAVHIRQGGPRLLHHGPKSRN